MKTKDEVVDILLKEMFFRVGEKYPNKRFTKDPLWYMKRTWTEEEQLSYKHWLLNTLKKHFPQLSKRKAEFEAGIFLLQYGWRVQ